MATVVVVSPVRSLGTSVGLRPALASGPVQVFLTPTPGAVVDALSNPVHLTAVVNGDDPASYLSIYDEDNRRLQSCVTSLTDTCSVDFSVDSKTTHTFTSYNSDDVPDTSPPLQNVKDSANVTVSNVGYPGNLLLDVDPDRNTEVDTIWVKASTTRGLPERYTLSLYDDNSHRMSVCYMWDTCGGEINASVWTTQTRTYWAYLGETDPPLEAPPTNAELSASITIGAGGGVTSQVVDGINLLDITQELTANQIDNLLPFYPGTHNADSTVSDQQLAYEVAIDAGKDTRAALIAALAAGGGATGGLLWGALHDSSGYPSPSPSTHEPTPNPALDPAPAPLPAPWPVDNLTNILLAQNGDLGRPAAVAVAEKCLWYAARIYIDAYDTCRTLPIFASGSDAVEATNHDISALESYSPWVLLNYEKASGKPSRTWYDSISPCVSGTVPAAKSCDEYPFFASEQGGKLAIPTPGLQVVTTMDNTQQGSNYSGFISKCKLRTGTAPLDRQAANSTGGSLFLGVPLPPALEITTQKLCNDGS